MSVKIYNAYRIRRPLLEVHALLTGLSPKLREVAKKNQLTLIAKRFEKVFDEPLLEWDGKSSPPKPNREFYWPVMDKVREELDQAKLGNGLRDIDCSCRVQVFPISARECLARVLCERDALIKLIDTLPDFEDFHYQNATDRPDSVSEADWALRERLWRKATHDYRDTVSTSCLYTLVDYSYPFAGPDEIGPYLSDSQSRARRLAKDKVFARQVKRQRAAQGFTDDDSSQSQSWAGVMRVLRELDGGKFDLEVETIAAILAPHIQPIFGPGLTREPASGRTP